jgi:hypothetical protein
MIPQRILMAKKQNQKHDASCIGNKRGKARRAKRQGAKSVRQFLKKVDGEQL